MTKLCKRCKEEKPLSAFNKRSKGTKDGYQSYCRDCTNAAANRTNNIKYFGIDTTSLRAYLMEKQGGKCAICGEHKKLCLDHDHANGIFRGLLCDGCNHGLGMFRDNPKLLQSAITYLEHAQVNQ